MLVLGLVIQIFFDIYIIKHLPSNYDVIHMKISRLLEP